MKWFSKQLKDQSGFTLVEVLISIFILSIIITSASVAFVYASKITRENKYNMVSINLVNETIEYIRSLDFADIGTKKVEGGTVIFGDPKGDILQTDFKKIDGINYMINTSINWEEQGGWVETDTDWDYKSVRVSVVPEAMVGNLSLTKTIETYVSRDVNQPALSGANIKLRIIRGWNTVPGSNVPVLNAKVTLSEGSNAPRQVQTSSGGVARFIDLNPGNHTVEIDPSNLGMILEPGVAAEWPIINLADNSTQTAEFKAEYPCHSRITLKDLSGNPISIDPGSEGKITVNVPFPIGTIIDKPFYPENINSQGCLPQSFITGLWPVGLGYSGSYTISNVVVPIEYPCYFGSYEGIGASETLWTGKFDGPGTFKELTCYLGTIPVTPNDINTSWVDGTNKILSGYTALNLEGDGICDGKFSTTNFNDTIIMPSNSTFHFNATSIYFENIGSEPNPGLFLNNNSYLILHTGLVVFRGKVNGNGKIILKTTYETGCIEDAAPSIGDFIGAAPGVSYGKLYLTKPYINGETTIEPGLYYYYDGLVLPDNYTELIKVYKHNFVN